MKRFALAALFCLNFPEIRAQVYPRYEKNRPAAASKKKWNLLWQAEFENGGMIPNNRQVKETFHDIYYNGVNLRLGWQSEKGGEDLYHQRYHYPIYGIGLYASTFHKKEIGTPIALYGFTAIPIAPGRFRKWDFNYRISLGIASNFEPYDEANNPNNILLGSHRNVYIDLGAQANYKMGKRFQFGAGLAFRHFSNGSVKQPNKGINLVPFALSATYHPTEHIPDFSKDPDLPHKTDIAYHLHYAFGIKQFTPGNHQRFFKSTIGFYRSRSAGYKWRLGLGADFFYSDSGRDPAIAGYKAGRIGSLLSGGPSLYIDHILTQNLYLSGNIGVYAHRNRFNGEIKPFFLRIGIRHKMFNSFYGGVSIKAHMGKADFIEWTLGHTWPQNRKSNTRY